MFIDSILHQSATIGRIDKADKTAKEKKGITDLQELLQRVIDLIQENNTKAQSLLTHMQFHVDILYLIQAIDIDPIFTRPLMKLVIRALLLFCKNYYPNQMLMVPYIKQILNLRKHGFKVSKLLYQILKSAKKEEKRMIDYLLEELKHVIDPDVIRLLAALTNTSSEKHSKYIIKSLLALGMKKYFLMGLEDFELKHSLICKWRRDKQNPAGIEVKAHIYMIAAIGNCALRSEYARIQGSKLIPENYILDNLSNENTPYLLQGVYLQLYYCLYVYNGESTKKVREPPKLFAAVLKIILRDTEKSYQYEFALDSLYKKKRLLGPLREIAEDNKSFYSEQSNKGDIVNWDQKREKDTEFFHNPNEYWKMLYTQEKIETNKGGLLNFLCKTFALHSWKLNENTFTLISNIRSILMGFVDYLHKVYEDRNKELDLDELLLMVCKTLECLPTTRKVTDKNSLVPIDTQAEHSDGSISETHRHLVQPSEKEHNSGENSEISICREEDSYTLVINALKSYIIENNYTIRKAFKLFDGNVDCKVDKLELKKAIKLICGNQVSYQQIEEAVNHIEKTTGVREALLFVEMNGRLKKVLKKEQYKNYKQKVVDITDVELEEDEMINSKKVNTCLKHFIGDYMNCMEYFSSDTELKKFANKIFVTVTLFL